MRVPAPRFYEMSEDKSWYTSASTASPEGAYPSRSRCFRDVRVGTFTELPRQCIQRYAAIAHDSVLAPHLPQDVVRGDGSLQSRLSERQV